tara:strand:- start:21 stop:197 length:177 start_codon:yes stop_codon:yes gene_type:complete
VTVTVRVGVRVRVRIRVRVRGRVRGGLAFLARALVSASAIFAFFSASVSCEPRVVTSG